MVRPLPSSRRSGDRVGDEIAPEWGLREALVSNAEGNSQSGTMFFNQVSPLLKNVVAEQQARPEAAKGRDETFDYFLEIRLPPTVPPGHKFKLVEVTSC